jgi:sec-independent protein translocase protein TatA
MFGLGYGEMMIVGIVAVLLFGGRLPSVARSMGRSLTEFKKGMQDIDRDVKDAMYHEPPAVTHDDYDEPRAPRFEPPTTPPRTESDDAATPAEAAATGS